MVDDTVGFDYRNVNQKVEEHGVWQLYRLPLGHASVVRPSTAEAPVALAVHWLLDWVIVTDRSVSASTIIDRPVGVVWADVRVISSHVAWMHDAVAIRFQSDQAEGVVARPVLRFVWKRNLARLKLRLEAALIGL